MLKDKKKSSLILINWITFLFLDKYGHKITIYLMCHNHGAPNEDLTCYLVVIMYLW